MKIYPSLISADLMHLGDIICTLDKECDGYHLDVMDFHFVPNLTWGPAFINAIRAITKLPLQVHLMVDNPLKIIDMLLLQQGDSCIIHYESVQNHQEILMHIKKKGLRSGIALNPKTSAAVVSSLVSYIDEVLVMSVEPGFSGQKFIDVTDKISALLQLKIHKGVNFSIGMDGGIGVHHIAFLNKIGVESIGVAAAIFNNKNMVENIRNLYAEIKD